MSLEKRAKKIGVSKSTLHRWLYSNTVPSPLAKEKLKEKDPELYTKLEKLWQQS